MIRNLSRQSLIARDVRRARSFIAKAVGLLGDQRPLAQGEALVIPSLVPWIHTFFMRYPIDIIFVSPTHVVVGMECMKPWRLSKIYWRADRAIELAAGAIERSSTHVGDKIAFTGG
ncbi:MAG: DUF192 domain-containing protein [Elusimicrobiota bacterium]